MDENTTKFAGQWRAYIGPPWRAATDPDYYDWTALDEGDVFAPVADTEAAVDLEPGASVVALVNPIAWPATGGCWVGPGAAGEAWEYVRYTGKPISSLTGCSRETVDSEQTGHHASGAAVRCWWPVNVAAPDLTVSQQTVGSLAGHAWTVQLTGVNFPQAALRNFHLCVICKREAVGVGGDWGAWTIALVGWLLNPKASDDYTGKATWSVTVGSSAAVLACIRAHGVRVGPYNQAGAGGATGSSELAKWYKLGSTGEGGRSTDTFEPAKAIDGTLRTFYASERYLGTPNQPPGPEANRAPTWGPYGIDQAHITQYTGQGKGGRWFQLVGPAGFRAPRLANLDCVWPDLKEPDYRMTGKMLLVENEALFRAENPDLDGDAVVVELNADTTNGCRQFTAGFQEGGHNASALTIAQWWDSFDPAAGAAYLMCGDQHYGGIVWGALTIAHLQAAHGWANNDLAAEGLAAPAAGQTIRRLWATQKDLTAAWQISQVSTPGYFLAAGGQLYNLYQLPGMGLELAADITGAAATLYVNVGGSPCTTGLPNTGTFTIQIDAEQITGTKRAAGDGIAVTARGANGTAAAAHVAGTALYIVEDGLATDAFPLATVELVRTPGQPTPRAFFLKGARTITRPRVVGDSLYTTDYDALADVLITDPNPFAGGAYTYTHAGAHKRYRWLLLVVERLTTDPYRLIVNEVRATVAADVFQATDYLATATVYQAAAAVLGTCGVKASGVLDGGGTPTVLGYTTAPEYGWTIVPDLMDMTGCYAAVGRDSKITIGLHPRAWTTAGIPAATLGWTKTTLSHFEPDFAHGRLTGQVELAWQSLDGSAGGVVRYPATRDPFGDVKKLGPLRFASAAAAQVAAENRYWLERIRFGGTGECAGAPWSVTPGLVHGVNWQIDRTLPAMDRTWLLDSVDLQLKDQGLTCVIHGLQIGREDER